MSSSEKKPNQFNKKLTRLCVKNQVASVKNRVGFKIAWEILTVVTATEEMATVSRMAGVRLKLAGWITNFCS